VKLPTITIPVLDAAQSAAWDECARTKAQIPGRVLMDAAGRAVAQVIGRALPHALERGVLVVAGHGNNGGDGWVVGRALHAVGCPVWGVETDHHRSPDCEANRRLALESGVALVSSNDPWPTAGVIVDALLGTGASGSPRGVIGNLAQRTAEHPAPVVAIDGPTGLDLSTGEAHGPVRAVLTVTFGGARRGHLLAREWCGEIVIADIGFPVPDPAWPLLFHDNDARQLLPPIRVTMHKGDRGRVLIVGGDEGMAGAALHAVSAAFAAGAGLVRLAGREATVRAAQASLPDALTLVTGLDRELEPALREALEWADAVVLGPGLGRGDARSAFVAAVIAACETPMVIDADALHAREALGQGTAARVLTPHPGEFQAAFPGLADRLADRFGAPEAAARESGTTVLLKGVPTVIARPDGGPSQVVASGNPALATGGSGDLLSGFIGSYLARGLDPPQAAALGAHTLGRGAEIAASEHGVRSTRPADVLAALPELWRLLDAPPAIRPPILLELPPPAVG
jgi:NAD(P)H-hydrate epimerase